MAWHNDKIALASLHALIVQCERESQSLLISGESGAGKVNFDTTHAYTL